MKHIAMLTIVVGIIFLIMHFTKKNVDEKYKHISYQEILGGVAETDAEKLFNNDIKISIDSSGSIYILDKKACIIKKYDCNGKYMFTFGRKGQGPGEFVIPKSLSIDEYGYIYVADLVKRTIEIYDGNGKYYSYIKIKPAYQDISVMALSRDSIYVSTSIGDTLIYLYNSKGVVINSFCGAVKEKTRLGQAMSNLISMTIDSGKNIWVSFNGQPIIRKYSREGYLLAEHQITTKRVALEKEKEKNNPEAKKTEFYHYGFDIIYAKKNIYQSSLGQILVINPFSGNVDEILLPSSNDAEKQFFFANLVYNPKTKEFLFSHKYQSAVKKIIGF